jgi:hypothetical protein
MLLSQRMGHPRRTRRPPQKNQNSKTSLATFVPNTIGERAGVRGSFWTAATRESPLGRPNGHLLPRGAEGPLFHSANSGQETPSVNRSRQTWRCPARYSPEITCCFYCGEKSQPDTSVRDFSARCRSLAYASGCDLGNLFRDWFLA